MNGPAVMHKKVCPECRARFETPYADKLYDTDRCKRKASSRREYAQHFKSLGCDGPIRAAHREASANA